MSNQQLGFLIITIGVGVILFGGLSWFGKLPGDMRIEGQSWRDFGSGRSA